MKFGETVTQWHTRKMKRRNKMEEAGLLEWHPWFAWYWVDLDDGRTAWLETVERKYVGLWAYSVHLTPTYRAKE
jgi:hypothetical protein